MDEELKTKLLEGKKLTSKEVEEVVDYAQFKEVGEDRRWYRGMESIYETDGRYFRVYWDKGLTEYQDNEYEAQTAQEVIRQEKVITTHIWVKKGELK